MKSLTAAKRVRGRPLHRRRHMKTRRRWTWRSLFHTPIPQLVILLLVLGGLYTLATSRIFAITQVEIVGDASMPQSVLQKSCACTGANIFLTRPDTIRQRLLRVAWVQVRQVYARLPDRIVIDAVYRQPAALWRTSVATYTVGLDGTVLYDLHNPPIAASLIPTTATVPIIYNAEDTTFTSGQRVPVLALTLAAATRRDVARELAPSVDRFRWSPVSGLYAHSSKGWWFAVGKDVGDALQERLHTLYGAYKKGVMASNHCNYVDLQPLPYVYCNYYLAWHGFWGPGSR